MSNIFLRTAHSHDLLIFASKELQQSFLSQHLWWQSKPLLCCSGLPYHNCATLPSGQQRETNLGTYCIKHLYISYQTDAECNFCPARSLAVRFASSIPLLHFLSSAPPAHQFTLVSTTHGKEPHAKLFMLAINMLLKVYSFFIPNRELADCHALTVVSKEIQKQWVRIVLVWPWVTCHRTHRRT